MGCHNTTKLPRYDSEMFSLMIFFMLRMKQIAILVALVCCMMVHDTSSAPAPDSAMKGKIYTKQSSKSKQEMIFPNMTQHLFFLLVPYTSIFTGISKGCKQQNINVIS